jgi:mono/diheme cytochrome c family protein
VKSGLFAGLFVGAAILPFAACSESQVAAPPLRAAGTIAQPAVTSAPSTNPIVVAAADTPAPVPAQTGEQMFNTECGACHMAYPPEFLPVRSWQALMGGLSSHFGENASLDPATEQKITDYLVANGAGPGSPAFRGLDAQAIPLRITDTPLWIRIHHEVRSSVYDRPDIKSKSNCLACHGGGARVGDD